MNQYAELAQKLKPYIVQWKLQTSTTNIVTTTTAPTSVAWSNINFAGSSIGDITNRTHSLLTGRENDDHTQYVMQTGRGGYATIDAILKVRYPSDSRYRWDITQAGAAGSLINSYDDTAAVYLPLSIDSSVLTLRPNADTSKQMAIGSDGSITAASGVETNNVIGNLRLSPSGYTGFAGIKHQSLAGNSDGFAVLQNASGSTVLNSASGTALHLKNGNQQRFSLVDNLTWYSGAPSIVTNNYVSQLTGLRIGYDGSIDARYLYADQLHVKTFIADLEQALAGLQIISKSVAELHTDFTVPFPGQTAPFTVKDLPSAPGMQAYQANDFVRFRQFDRTGGSLNITDCWGQVTGPNDNLDKTQSWTLTRSGTATLNTVTFVATQSQGITAGTTSTVTKPTGTTTNDVLWAVVAYAGTPTITPPSGWTLYITQIGTGVTMLVYYKQAGGSEPSNYAWTYSVATNAHVSISTYRNCYAAFFIDGTNYTANSASTSFTFPGGITPRSIGDMQLVIGATVNIRATPPAGFTKRVDLGAGSVGTYMAEKLLSSAATTSTATGTLASSSASIGAQICLLPSYSALSLEAGQASPFSTIKAGTLVLDYGISGNGYAEVNAIDGNYAANSPYYQIVTWVTHPTNVTLKMRLGNLNGLSANINGSGLSPTGYGLFTDNAFLAGTFVAGGGYFKIDSNGANISTQGDITWSLAAGFDNISLSNYQSYSFRDPGYFGGIAGGKATTYDRVMIYNQQRYVDKSANIIIDARHVTHDTLGTPTYSRDASITLAASRWLPDSGIIAATTLVVEETASGYGQITLTADDIYLTGEVQPLNTSTDALTINMPASNSGKAWLAKYNGTTRVYAEATLTRSQIVFPSFDNGSDVGPTINIGRNSNGSTPAAGLLYIMARSATQYAIWPDNSGNLRIGTSSPTSANDTTGTVVGTQSSSLASKNIADSLPDMREAYQHILQAARNGLRAWSYKNNAYNGEYFPNGIVTDYAPRYGMDRSESNPHGKSLNTPVAIGDLMASILVISERLDRLEKANGYPNF